jgi:hypothetical protein
MTPRAGAGPTDDSKPALPKRAFNPDGPIRIAENLTVNIFAPATNAKKVLCQEFFEKR